MFTLSHREKSWSPKILHLQILALQLNFYPLKHDGDIYVYLCNETDQDDDFWHQQGIDNDNVMCAFKGSSHLIYLKMCQTIISVIEAVSHLMLSVQQWQDATIDIFQSIDLVSYSSE